jgi:hypothetical protein
MSAVTKPARDALSSVRVTAPKESTLEATGMSDPNPNGELPVNVPEPVMDRAELRAERAAVVIAAPAVSTSSGVFICESEMTVSLNGTMVKLTKGMRLSDAKYGGGKIEAFRKMGVKMRPAE